jgi:undecaprenyl-diphosphatase
MHVIQFLDSIDKQLFLFLNGLNCNGFDIIMWQISGKFIWIPLYVLIIWFIGKERKWNVFATIVLLAIMIVISDQISGVIKDAVLRLRPSHNPLFTNIVHLVNDSHGNLYRGGTYGFVSSHAANTFALATFVTLFFGKRWIGVSVFIWAAIVSYSRIYLGVHYPFDVLGGAFVGVFSGLLVFWVEKKVIKRLNRSNP